MLVLGIVASGSGNLAPAAAAAVLGTYAIVLLIVGTQTVLRSDVA